MGKEREGKGKGGREREEKTNGEGVEERAWRSFP